VKKFLIDVNLPYYFSLWNGDEYIHQRDINDEWSDEKIWEYAKENNLTIVTKDSDFSHRIILHEPPPKVIHIRIGNVNMKDFFNILSNSWSIVCEMNMKYKLINIFKDSIEAVE
jgi:predicted nuclease of predicted toxin-antitoxin system